MVVGLEMRCVCWGGVRKFYGWCGAVGGVAFCIAVGGWGGEERFLGSVFFVFDEEKRGTCRFRGRGEVSVYLDVLPASLGGVLDTYLLLPSLPSA